MYRFSFFLAWSKKSKPDSPKTLSNITKLFLTSFSWSKLVPVKSLTFLFKPSKKTLSSFSIGFSFNKTALDVTKNSLIFSLKAVPKIVPLPCVK